LADYYYSAQIRRFLIQFGKIFSSWSVTKGNDPAGNLILMRVPVMYGDQSRQAAAAIANNSSSNLPSAPLITFYVSGLEYDQKRTQEPFFVEKLQLRQRAYDQDSQDYQTTQGQAYTVERMMPVPYMLRITVDIWTTNTQQKHELIEQLGVLFNPSIEIQSTDNYIDWTSLTVVQQDSLNYTSRSIPQGTGNPIDILTWKFSMPIWISAPIKLKKMGVIHKIIASIHEGSTIDDIQDDDILLGTRQKITAYGYKVLLLGNSLQILPSNQPFNPSNSELDVPESPNTSVYWSSVLNVYGAVKPGISQIWLQNPYMDTDIVGTIVLDPLDDRLLIYNIDPDTLPQNTLAPVDSVINPLLTGPNAGQPDAINGKRYLIVESIGAEDNSTPAWGTLIANANDIIEYDAASNQWFVAFDSNNNIDNIEFVTNINTGIQYRFAEGVWMKSVDGWYSDGSWSVVI
jgi:hypothetical protein